MKNKIEFENIDLIEKILIDQDEKQILFTINNINNSIKETQEKLKHLFSSLNCHKQTLQMKKNERMRIFANKLNLNSYLLSNKNEKNKYKRRCSIF